jgi:hypothetical protein
MKMIRHFTIELTKMKGWDEKICKIWIQDDST